MILIPYLVYYSNVFVPSGFICQATKYVEIAQGNSLVLL